MRIIKRLGFGAALAATLAGTPAKAADDIVFSSDNPLAQWLMPFSPLIFDLSVQFGRSLAEITYERRGFDPLTGSFSVSGLHVRRGSLDVTVGRARIGPEMTLVEDLSIDTTKLDLPPQARQALDRLGGRVTGDILVRVRFNEARNAFDLVTTLDFPQAGLIEVAALVDQFHILVPLSEIDTGLPPADPAEPQEPAGAAEPVVTGFLHRAAVTYRDDGLIDVVAAIVAQDAGVSGDQLLEGIAVMPVMTVEELLNGLAGGASPALRERVLGWARAVEVFLRERDAIRVSFDPADPVPLALLQTGVFDEALVAALNPTFSDAAQGPALADAPAVGPVEEALALINGRGVPQNREDGALRLIDLARAGDGAAVRALAAAFGQGPLPDLEGERRDALLVTLLAARAAGAGVSDETLAALGAQIGAEAVMKAEREAQSLFAQLPEGRDAARFSVQGLAALDARDLRAAAYDLFEGRGVARNLTEAYAVASVAAALGEPFAASLRDDLADAARNGTAAVSITEGRARADGLWRAIAARPGGTP